MPPTDDEPNRTLNTPWGKRPIADISESWDDCAGSPIEDIKKEIADMAKRSPTLREDAALLKEVPPGEAMCHLDPRALDAWEDVKPKLTELAEALKTTIPAGTDTITFKSHPDAAKHVQQLKDHQVRRPLGMLLLDSTDMEPPHVLEPFSPEITDMYKPHRDNLDEEHVNPKVAEHPFLGHLSLALRGLPTPGFDVHSLTTEEYTLVLLEFKRLVWMAKEADITWARNDALKETSK